jgi:ribosomal protein L19E
LIRAASHDSILQLTRSDASKAEAWRGVCSSGCYRAKTDKKKCKCRCGGEHHGKGHANRQEENRINDFF